MNFFNPYQNNNYPTTNYPQYNNGGNFFYINGRKAAEDWVVAPGSVVCLLDRQNKQFYIKTVERNGLVKPLEVFNIAPMEQETQPKIEYATKDDLIIMKNEIMAKIGKNEPIVEVENEQLIPNGTANQE